MTPALRTRSSLGDTIADEPNVIRRTLYIGAWRLHREPTPRRDAEEAANTFVQAIGPLLADQVPEEDWTARFTLDSNTKLIEESDVEKAGAPTIAGMVMGEQKKPSEVFRDAESRRPSAARAKGQPTRDTKGS